jgi:hypothetical protein
MRELPGFIPVNDAVTFTNSVALNIGDNVNCGIFITISGSDVVGSLKLQASPDNVGWFDIADSTVDVTASADTAYNVTGMHAPYVRVFWTYTSGTGNISASAIINEQMLHRGG